MSKKIKFRAGGLLNRVPKPKIRKSNKRINKRKIWKFLGYMALSFVLFIVLLFAWYAKDLPTPEKLAARRATESTKIFDRNGNLLYSTGEKRRTVIDAKDMPPSIRQATVAIEDQDFYKHHGLNFKGIARAIYVDVTRGRASQGGSTITQQFVKNALLSSKKSLSRKIKEVILSIELEQTRSKDEILTLYLNEIPYGSNIYGIEEASKAYFGKDAKDLNLSESATLAALPQRPTYFSPWGTHTDDLFLRKNRVLEEMVSMNFITQEEADKAKKEAPKKDDPKFVQRQENIKAPHFVLFVRERLIDLYGEQMVNEGGLQVTTTLDGDMQGMAEEAIKEGSTKLDRYGANNTALVSTDPKTGQVLAMVGSKDYFDIKNDGNVNVTLANRQPGSAFKPFAYATGFKQKYNPAYTLFDLRTDFGGGYSPEDYDGRTRGPVSARYALANSLNIPAVKMLSLAGVQNTIDTARDLGITTLTDPSRYGLALVLGGGEVKPLEMAGAYGGFANGGNFATLTPFLKIQDSSNKTLFEFKQGTNIKKVLDPQIAYEITSILSDNDVRRDIFGTSLVIGDYKVAVKTGTTQEFRDAWTCGATPSLSTVVWVGNNDNTKMRAGADGSIVAAPIFRNFMLKALPKYPNEDFAKPDGIKEETVEKFSNRLPTQYSQQFVKDIFAGWQVPTEKDNVNVVVKVNKLNGQLATDSTPPALIELRVYRDIHSERPDYPNWEDPVRAWAAANGYVGKPPSSKDDSYSGKNISISITSPSNGASYNAGSAVNVAANVSADYGVKEVQFTLGSRSVTDTGSPYSASLDTGGFAPGDYTLTAKVSDNNGASAQTSITITVNASSHTQSGITVSGVTGNAAMVSFATSVATTAQVKYGTDAGNLNLGKSDSFNSKNHAITLTGLSAHTKYYFQVLSTAGSTVTSSIYSFTTL